LRAWREVSGLHGEGRGWGDGCTRCLLYSWTESWDVFPIGFVPVWLRAWREGKEVHGMTEKKRKMDVNVGSGLHGEGRGWGIDVHVVCSTAGLSRGMFSQLVLSLSG